MLFSLTLAALTKPKNPSCSPLIKRCSSNFLYLLLPDSPSPSSESLINPILALIPLMLQSRNEEIVCTAAKIIGAASLVSIEVNERIALDCAIVRGLVSEIVRSQRGAVKKALCNAFLDLSITSLGCQRLLELSGLDYVMLGFLQVQKSRTSTASINVIVKEDNIYLGVEHFEDELLLLLLNAVVTLTNFCNTEQLNKISRRLIKTIFPYLKGIWSKVRDQLLASEILNISKGKCCYLSNVTAYNLAESLFRLSLDAPGLTCSIPSEVVIRHIFGPCSSSFKNFMLEHWESSPFLVRKLPKDLDKQHYIFSSFMCSLTCEVPRFLSSILRGMVSCPPVASNEINTPSFLNEVRDMLGCPIIYEQDIRVVRTNLHSKSEEHYFQRSSSKGDEFDVPRSFSVGDILKCEVAYGEGYTIALRGMEFRSENIAAIAQEVASLFGQPSIGANLYVTPPNSQGLACHCDDHCVFVCQLQGSKQWTLFRQQKIQLPRLYEHLEAPQDLVESRQILLREGDVLYIPRGLAHEARTFTDISASTKDCESSVHLTLAIEVEPPFEWEGFAHVALHRWSHDVWSDNFAPGSAGILRTISVNILHVAIRLVSNTELVFRKACLVAASSLHRETKEWLETNQKSIFDLVINKINELASFTDSLKFLKMAVQRNEHPFHWLRWLEHLHARELFVRGICDFTSDRVCNILPFIYQHKDDAEAAFAFVKSKFCSEVLFDDAKDSFMILHAMYKEARMKYTNGILSLHSQ